MAFEFKAPARIVFGRGSSAGLPEIVQSLGTRPLCVTGSARPRVTALLAAIGAAEPIRIHGEPSIPDVILGVERARKEGADSIVAIGGGSVIDAAKAIAALAANSGDVYDYLEVVGQGKPLRTPALPTIAVPTTAGTGAEATKNAVLQVPDKRVKVSLRHDSLLPKVALVDSELCWTVPPDVTAATGLDALTQVLEPYVSHVANPITDALCVAALGRAGRALRGAYHDGADAEARDDLSFVSLCGGMALANAKLGAVHGFAAPLGGMFDAPHGALCARLLPLVMAANLRALAERAPRSPALQRYAHAAQLLTGLPDASSADGIAWLEALCVQLCIPPLAAYGVSASDISEIVVKAAKSSSMQGNPIQLTDSELRSILEKAL